MTHITAIAPVLNEIGNVRELVTRLHAALSGITEDYAILIVDDGSTDGTWDEIAKLAGEDGRAGGVRLLRNFGQHTAISAGLQVADADWTVVLDGDLQDRPEVIPDLYAKAQEGYDCVFVERENRPEGRAYMALQKLFYGTLQFLTETSYNGAHGNFSIISRDVLEAYQNLHEGQRFYGGLVNWMGFSRGSLRAAHGERFSGKPSYNFRRRADFAKNIVLSFSSKPLQLTLNVGLLVTIGALLFGAFIFVRALFFDYSMEGWASLMVSIYFLGGVQMIMIGMVGLYVGRISEEIRRRPTHLERERILPGAAKKTTELRATVGG